MAEPLVTRRGTLAVPTFLPDATRAGVRGLTSEDLRGVGIEGVVVNAFHLLRRPGARVVQAAGGIHEFMDWSGPILSDSGGFQVWSLIRQDPSRGVIRDNEVIFREPSTGEKWTLTPERIVGLQFQLGSDIVVCLDDCTDSEAPLAEQERSVERTVKWARRCREEFDRRVSVRGRRGTGAVDPPRIFAVVQGGGIEALRRQCATALAEIGFDGYGFGGWPLAADGSLLTDALRWVAEGLPEEAPKHALGIGRPDHVVSAFALGYSIFDCALPTRDARHGRLYAFRPGWGSQRPEPGDDFYRAVRIHDPEYRVLHAPVEEGCDCLLCSRYSAAYLHHLFKVGDMSAERLATLHNLRFYVRLFGLLRDGAGLPPSPAADVATGQMSV
jgi:queuine tRNA-ribosyltransferase